MVWLPFQKHEEIQNDIERARWKDSETERQFFKLEVKYETQEEDLNSQT